MSPQTTSAGERERSTRRLVTALLLAAALTGLVDCAGGGAAQQPCPTEEWAGKCQLRDLRKVEERELPIPYVVYEATYSPEPNPNYPAFTPADARMRFGTPARNEFALVDHLKPQTEVDCHASVIQGSCQPRELVANVTPFDPDRAPAAALPQTTGCAAIDAASEQDRLAQSETTPNPITERFSFAADSAELSSDATASAQVIVKRMSDDPNLECVGLVGQNSPSESVSLAEARALAVKRLLISMGVDGKRLVTMAATASVYGPAQKMQAIQPEVRRVTVSVLLDSKQKVAR